MKNETDILKNDLKTLGPVKAIETESYPRWLSWLFLAAALVYCLIIPPFQSPDETFHFFKSYQVAVGGVKNTHGQGGLGYVLPQDVRELTGSTFPLKAVESGEKYVVSDVLKHVFHTSHTSGSVFVVFPNAASYSPTMYLPQALGIFVARALDAPILLQFYSGRFVNALCGILLALAAISIMPFGRSVMVGILALPMTLFQIGSLSPDSTILGLSFLVTAMAFYSIQPRNMMNWQSVAMPLAIIGLILAKGVYLPIAAAGFSIKNKLSNRNQLIVLGAIAAGIVLFLAWTALGGHGGGFQASLVSRKTLQREITAIPMEQLQFILASPFSYCYVLITSIVDRLPTYIVGIIGRFGWNTIILPIPLYLFAGFALVVCLVKSASAKKTVDKGQLTWWLILCLGMLVLIETALYLTGTPYGADYIQGTQGRYFTPFLPLLGIVMAGFLRTTSAWQRFTEKMFAPSIVVLIAGGVMAACVSYWTI